MHYQLFFRLSDMRGCLRQNGSKTKIEKLTKRIYQKLLLSGYARLDLRMDAVGDIYVLEANPNAAITHDDELALSAKKAGYTYEGLIERLLKLGLQTHKS